MDDALLMGGVDGVGEDLDQPGRLARRQRGAVQMPSQTAAAAKFQREERLALVLADLEDLHDVRMLQAGDGLGLTAEAGQLALVGIAAGQNHFQGDDAVGLDLPGPVDNAHSAASEDAQDLVAGDGRQHAFCVRGQRCRFRNGVRSIRGGRGEGRVFRAERRGQLAFGRGRGPLLTVLRAWSGYR